VAVKPEFLFRQEEEITAKVDRYRGQLERRSLRSKKKFYHGVPAMCIAHA
jgi:hypothetical protein